MYLLVCINKANFINKKSRSESRKNVTDKISRNPAGLVNTLSNKSIKDNQKSLDQLELKAKKMLLSSSQNSVEERKVEKDNIAIYAGFRTTKGYHPKKPEKSNQDRMLIMSKFNNAPNQWVFTVLDGHGTDGHKVSQFIRDHL